MRFFIEKGFITLKNVVKYYLFGSRKQNKFDL